MRVNESSIVGKAFGEDADPDLIVAYQSHQDALRFLAEALAQSSGVALIQGPRGAGKTKIAKEQAAWSARDAVVAFVDGVHLAPRRFLTDLLTQFDLPGGAREDDQILQSLSIFLAQQTRCGASPILIVDDADRASASALRLLNWLAALDVRGEYSLRIVLTGKERLAGMLRTNSMNGLLRRNPSTYSLNPLTSRETMIYLRTKLIAAGGERAEKVFPIEVCERLRELSSGWPGLLDERAAEILESKLVQKPTSAVPRVIVSREGAVVSEHELTERQYVIGRSELADIVVEDGYVSKIHAMLQVYSNAIVLADLNSTNGTTVNSRVVQKTVLRDNDIITLGRYTLKIENAPALSAELDEKVRASDTLTMQNLDDLRRVRARRTIAVLKHK
jgi:type II secretory pathway predicted ATPase ExeA